MPADRPHNRTVAVARPQAVGHGGACGLRFRTECCGDRFDPYLTGERLRNGDYLCHGCGHRWRHAPDWRLAA